ncbi:hypothetical protein MTO96_041914 [Rhipicephalus appendiculatus]
MLMQQWRVRFAHQRLPPLYVSVTVLARDHSTNFPFTSPHCSGYTHTSPGSAPNSANGAETSLATLYLQRNGFSYPRPHSPRRSFHAEGRVTHDDSSAQALKPKATARGRPPF